MRLAVDATLVARRLKGTGRVLVGLLRAFPAVAPDWELVALATREGSTVLEESTVSAEIMTVPVGSGAIWELHGFPHAAVDAKADFAMTLREIVGFGGPPTLLHIAEPPSWRTGQGGRPLKHQLKDRLLSSMLSGSVRRADLVTAASASTADWLREHHGVIAPVVPPGIDAFFFEPDKSSSDEGEYFLHAASGDQRDNTNVVLRAFAESHLSSYGVRLITVGATEDFARALRSSVSELSLDQHVEIANWVSDARLRQLYRGAIALVQPASFEGFVGLQQLEAMAQGTPLIVLDAVGVSEVLAGIALILPALDYRQLAAAMVDLYSDAKTRERLARGGRRFAAGFTWERSAQAFAECIGGFMAR